MNVPAALVLIAFLTLVAIHYRRQDILEGRARRERELEGSGPRCQVIGCDDRPARRWMPNEGVHACDRCAEDLDALRGAFTGSRCAVVDCPRPVVTTVHGWALCAGHVVQRGGVA